MSRASKRSSLGCGLAALALCGGCSAARSSPAESASSANGGSRRAPGVAEQRSPVLPEPTNMGNTRDQWLVLRAPAASDLAREAVRGFLRATVNEALERMDP